MTQAKSETRADFETLRRLLPYLWQPQLGLRARVVFAILFLLAAKVASVIVPFFYKHAVDALSLSPTQALLAVPVVAIVSYGLARIASQAFADLRDAVFTKVLQRAIRQLALEVFNHLHALALRFHLERQTGGLSRVIERGTKAIETLMSFLLFNTLPVLIELVLVLGILVYLFDWRFAAITFATIGLYIYYTIAITEWRLKIRREMNEQDTRANSKAIDSLLNYETVKYFGNEQHEARRYDSSLQAYEKSAVLSRTSLALLNIGQAFIIQAGLVAVMWLAARGVVAGTLTVGDFVLVNAYLLQLAMPLFIFGTAYREIKQGLVDMEKMFDLLSVNREIADAPDAKTLTVTRGRLVFDNVNFSYDARRPILQGVSFVAEPGQTVAVVGSSGAGKSTLSRLLFRFYDIGSGSITIDGQDIRAVTQASLRAALGIVPQDTVLFNDTIAYNIGYGKPSATQAEIEAAAQMAQIHDFCTKLPDGYNTVVGERGLKLSGGEKQRVAIARTILKNPPLLVFDEATSALDTHTEKDIQASLKAVSKGRTTLMIAHRLSTVAEADLILVLEAGVVAERGTHAELLSKNGLYAALWKRQLEAETQPV
jgi:ATP-binding cassette, subfamily B, heavy metal transporter